MKNRTLYAKALVHTFDIKCPYCECGIYRYDGQISHSIYEGVDQYLKCDHCGKTSMAPKRVPSARTHISGAAKK